MRVLQEPSAVLESVRSLSADIRALAPQIEQARRLPPELVARLAGAGVFRLCMPRALGGLEAEPAMVLQVIEELSRADGATGWCAMIGSTTAILSGYLEDGPAQTVYGANPDVITGGVVVPLGKADGVEGGHRVSGRWPFASGCQHSGWLVGGSILCKQGVPRLRDGAPEARLMLFRASDVQIHDTWQVSGLRGSGSHDIEVSDVFVPAGFSVSLTTDRPRHPGPLYAFPVFGLLSLGIAAVTLGIGRAAVDEFLRVAGRKVSFGTQKPLGAKPTIQVLVSEAEAHLRAARAFLFGAVDGCWRIVLARGEVPLEQRAELRLAAVHAAASAARAVDLAYHAAGGTSIYEASPLQRYFRDIHVATQHALVASGMYETAGRVLLGIETDTSRL